MEKLKKILLAVIVISIMNSCVMKPEPPDLHNHYTIKNVSTHSVKLKVFNAYLNYVFKDTTFVFSTNSEILLSFINTSPDRPLSGFESSAYIIFDNIKQIIYVRDDGQARNILDINSYVEGKVNQYQYEITDEDYANAVEIK